MRKYSFRQTHWHLYTIVFLYKTRSKRFWRREKSKSNDFLALQCTNFSLKAAHFSKFRSKIFLVNSFLYDFLSNLNKQLFTIIFRKQIFSRKCNCLSKQILKIILFSKNDFFLYSTTNWHSLNELYNIICQYNHCKTDMKMLIMIQILPVVVK